MSNVKCKTNFQGIWLENEEYKPWLQKAENNPHMTRCKVCVKDISIAAYGITAINTHAKWSKHKERSPKLGSQSFFKTVEVHRQNCQNLPASSLLLILAQVEPSPLMRNNVGFGYSFNSSLNKSELFAAMFSDSEVAKTFQCGKSKCGYLVNSNVANQNVVTL